MNRIYQVLAISFALCIFGVSVQGHAAGVAAANDIASGDRNTAKLLLIIYVVMALVFSFLCSIAEAVLLSITPSYIELQKEKRPQFAPVLKRLKQDEVDRSLSAILTLNTIAHTMGAIGAGSQATILFGSAWVGLVSFVMTLAILIFTEIIPKTIGAVYWTKLVRPTMVYIKTLILILYPLVWMSEKITRFISRGKPTHIFSQDEFVAMAMAGASIGKIRNSESSIIKNMFRLESLQVTDIMTPRIVVSALPQNMTVDDSLKKVADLPFSRLPVFGESIDDITGFVLKNDILISATQMRGGDKLEILKRELLAIPETISLTVLFDQFLKERHHIAIIINEYGGTSGIMTLEDLLETLLGLEIMDETDNVEDMRALARKKWLERAKRMGIEPAGP